MRLKLFFKKFIFILLTLTISLFFIVLYKEVQGLYKKAEEEVFDSPAFNRHLTRTLNRLTGMETPVNDEDIVVIGPGNIMSLDTNDNSTSDYTCGSSGYTCASTCIGNCGTHDSSCGSETFDSDCGSSGTSDSSCNSDGGGSSGPSPEEEEAQDAIEEAEEAQDNAEAEMEEALESGDAETIAEAAETAAEAEESLAEAKQNAEDATEQAEQNAQQEQETQEETNQDTNANNTPETGDPVKIATGVFTTGETDLSYTFGNMTVKIVRTYQSNRLSSHSFGPGWIFNYDTRVIMGVKPNAEAEYQFIQAKYEETENMSQELLNSYHTSLNKLETALQDAWEAQTAAATFLQKAQEAVDKANLTDNASLKQQAGDLLSAATDLKAREQL